MVREKTVVISEKEKVYTWKKNTPGNLRILGRIIKENETFSAPVSAIPVIFRQDLICLDEGIMKEDQLKEEAQLKEAYTPEFKLEPVEVEGKKSPLYNVVNEEGKVFNDKPLSKTEATKILEVLMS